MYLKGAMVRKTSAKLVTVAGMVKGRFAAADVGDMAIDRVHRLLDVVLPQAVALNHEASNGAMEGVDVGEGELVGVLVPVRDGEALRVLVLVRDDEGESVFVLERDGEAERVFVLESDGEDEPVGGIDGRTMGGIVGSTTTGKGENDGSTGKPNRPVGTWESRPASSTAPLPPRKTASAGATTRYRKRKWKGVMLPPKRFSCVGGIGRRRYPHKLL